ncbi:MAG: NAD+ synthase [Dehalococcoidia bacterium]|nr:NAD+ synthase [Dehalococcoidia bacterium]MDW8120402.1 NAD+ synthase [Chloroflexota bacterium]
MRTFRIALAQVNPTVGDLQGNRDLVLRFAREAAAQGADLVAFPELVVTGYPPEDLLLKPQFIRDNLKVAQELAAASTRIPMLFGFVDMRDNEVYNAAALAAEGRIVGVYHKIYLPNYGVFDEDRYFRPGRVCPVFVLNGTPLGINICEDIWYAIGPVAVQREAGAEVIVNINGSPYHMGKRLFREKMLATRASDNLLFIAYVNTVGGQDELVFDGASMVFDQNGDLVARAKQFQEDLLVVDLPVESVFRQRLRDPRPRKDAPFLQHIGTAQRIHVSAYSPRERPPITPRTEEPLDPIGEVYHALVLGVRDYVRKTGHQKVVIGLSGGIDSSVTCCVAVDALGPQNVLGISMPSRYSSEGSILDARALAQNLGVDLWVVPIEPAHAAYLDMLAPHFKDLPPDVTEENIQARIRGNILMAISNKFGMLVLSTGNKSEMATGYCTLYGDMAGGYAVLKDVPKTLVYRLAEWRNAHGTPPNPIPPSVLKKPPSAELRPGQRTEEERLPFRLLDPILKAYVEEDRTFEEIVAMGYDAEVVKRIIRWVDRNEYKRRQAPPGIKITPRAFGRDRRMPIVNRYPHF